MNTRVWMSIVLWTCAGCTEYQTAQLQLIDQARKGLAAVVEGQSQQSGRIDELDRLGREKLDQAFERDVLETPGLTPDWVIAHRKAYAVGLSALAQQHSAARASVQGVTRNLAAVDNALAALRRIKLAEMNLTSSEK